MPRSSRPSARRAWSRATRAKWSERRSGSTRRGGASSSRNAECRAGVGRPQQELEAAQGRLFWSLEGERMSTSKLKIGIVGGTGYTGVELLRLLAGHPHAELAVITSRAEAGTAVAKIFPSLRGRVALSFSAPDPEALGGCDLVFFA